MKGKEGLRWDDVRVFLAIRRHGTMAGAARELAVDQTTVGRRLASLETSLDARLFDRTPEGLAMTPAGEAVIDAALRIEDSVLALERQALGQDRRSEGTVRIATSEAFAVHYLVPRLGRLREQYPGLTLEVVTGQSFVALSRREADIALRNRPRGSPPAQENVVCRRVGEVAWAIHAARAYLDRRRGCGADVSGDTFVDYDPATVGLPGLEELRELASSGVVATRVSSILAARAAAVAGQGLALLPCFIGPELERVGPVRGWADVWLLVHPDLQHVARVRSIIDGIVAMFQADAPMLTGAGCDRA